MAKSKQINKSHSNAVAPLRAASANQEIALQMFKDKTITVIEGLAGTGKTYLAIHYALTQLFSHKISKIILTRPLVNVGEEKLGFLPGEVENKVAPYAEQFNEYMNEFMPMIQMSDAKKIQNTLEFIPLAYIRGRNFADAVIIADEMQNSTQLQMKTLLTRIAENTKIIILGDTKQSDRVDNNRTKNGLVDLVDKVSEHPTSDIGVVKFTKEDIQRSGIIRYVMKIYGDLD